MLWLLTAAALAALVAAGPAAAWGSWVPLHALLLGGIGSAITMWSAHFADTLLHRPPLGGHTLLNARLALHSLGAVLVLVGITASRGILAMVGVTLIIVAALAGFLAIAVQKRRAVAPAMGGLTRYYMVSLGLMALGGVWGYLTSWASDTGRAAASDAFYIAHTMGMMLGFVGLTVLGTFVLLWPTMLRTPMEAGALRQAMRALPVLVGGVAVAAAGGIWPPLLALGLLVYLTGSMGILAPACSTASRVRPRSFATLSAAAAIVWFLACLLILAIQAALAADVTALRESIHDLALPFAAGFGLQILAGALSYLMPIILGRGPAATRESNRIMDRAAAFRVAAANTALTIAVIPVLPWGVRTVSGLLAGAMTLWVVVSIAEATLRSARIRQSAAHRRVPASGGHVSHVSNAPSSPQAAASSVQATAFSAHSQSSPHSDSMPRRADGGYETTPQTSARRGALLGLATAGAAALLGGAVSASRGELAFGSSQARPTPTGRTVEATIRVEGMRFVPDTVDVQPGDRLLLTLDNTATQVHDLVLATGQTTGRIAAGAHGQLEVPLVDGPTEGWCSIAAHRAQGMVFHVTAAGQGTQASSPHASHGGNQPLAVDLQAPLPDGFEPYDAALPPAPDETTHRYTFTVTEVPEAYVGAGVTQTRWTFNGTAPGPVLRGKVGDTFEITLVNGGMMSHSIDFHAGITPPDELMRSINPGESLTYRFTAEHAGIWLYHCSTAPMSVHLASGMFGAVIIDSEGLANVDREYVLIQSEHYLGTDGQTDATKVAAKTPDLLSFNGVAFQYAHAPLPARTGERVRFWVLDAGPSLPSSFHVVGLQFDTVFHEGTYLLGGPEQRGRAWGGGAQALGLQPAQGGFVEAVVPGPGNYSIVTHAFADMEKGAQGILRAQ